MEDSKKLSYKSVVILGFLVYFFSYIMRIDYTAPMLLIAEESGIDKSLVLSAIRWSFITYGVGLITFGILGDKLSPIKLISLSLIGTLAVDFLFPFFSDINVLIVLFCLGGLFQALLLPSLTRFVLEQVGDNKYPSAITLISLSAPIGLMLTYWLMQSVLDFKAWQGALIYVAIFGLLVLGLWLYLTRNIKFFKTKAEENFSQTTTAKRWLFVLGLVPLIIITIVEATLRDSMQNWAPSLINDQFDLKENTSALWLLILPLFNIIGAVLGWLLYKKLKHEIKATAVACIIIFLATVLLILDLDMPPITVGAAALILGGASIVNHILIFILPKSFSKYGRVATSSGIINALTYIGFSISIFGLLPIVEIESWELVLIYCFLFAGVGVLACAFKIKGWTKFIKNKSDEID